MSVCVRMAHYHSFKDDHFVVAVVFVWVLLPLSSLSQPVTNSSAWTWPTPTPGPTHVVSFIQDRRKKSVYITPVRIIRSLSLLKSSLLLRKWTPHLDTSVGLVRVVQEVVLHFLVEQDVPHLPRGRGVVLRVVEEHLFALDQRLHKLVAVELVEAVPLDEGDLCRFGQHAREVGVVHPQEGRDGAGVQEGVRRRPRHEEGVARAVRRVRAVAVLARVDVPLGLLVAKDRHALPHQALDLRPRSLQSLRRLLQQGLPAAGLLALRTLSRLLLLRTLRAASDSLDSLHGVVEESVEGEDVDEDVVIRLDDVLGS